MQKAVEAANSLATDANVMRHVMALPYLATIGCCPRCALRFVNVKTYPLYREDPDFLRLVIQFLVERVQPPAAMLPAPLPISPAGRKRGRADKDKDKDKETEKEAVCVACLGILQRASDPAFVDPFIAHVQASGYDKGDFQLAISIPHSTYVRSFAIWYDLRSKFNQGTASAADGIPMFKDEDPELNVVEIKEALKWLLGRPLKLKLGMDFLWMSEFKIILVFEQPSSVKETHFIWEADGSPLKIAKKKDKPAPPPPADVSIPNLVKALNMIREPVFRNYSKCPPEIVTEAATLTMSYEHGPVFVAGRYEKWSRDLSQTPWVIEDKRISESSVEELICPTIQKHFRADSYNFSSAGREDIDVRMLPPGRPFVLELVNPHKTRFHEAQFGEMQEQVNRSTPRVQIRDLQRVSKADLSKLKDGEETKTKTYRCIVWVSRVVTAEDLKPLDNMRDLTIQQKTPVRVLHRRSLATRPKLIHSMKTELINPNFFVLELVTQAGTYIKEFIHSDLGRTQPSLGSLLQCEADILQLDVMSVALDFPPVL